MRTQEKRPTTALEKEVMEFLNTLRDSGITNMFGATTYIVDEFNIQNHTARRILALWMDNFNREGIYNEVIITI